MKKDKNLAFGIHPVEEALTSGKEIDKIYIKKGTSNEAIAQLVRTARQRSIPIQHVPVEKLNKIYRGNHQGIIAQLSLIEYKSIEEIVQRTYEEGLDPFIAVLDHITDVRNFGAIARTAECVGINAIVIPDKGAANITPDAIKTSAGALNRLAICRVHDLKDVINYLKNSGVTIIASTEKADEDHFKANLTGPAALIMGSEETGVSQQLLELSDTRIRIPMATNFDSLNVSVAFGIVSYEIMRQRLFVKS